MYVFFPKGVNILICRIAAQRGHSRQSTNGKEGNSSLQMFQRQLPDPQGEAGQPC